eukprot:3573324-Amphidinium_carterae.2
MAVQRGGSTWSGVGHCSSAGGGQCLNPFGEAFKAAGSSWTTALCEADSDGDGQSNGFELGDPDCVWTQGGAASRTTDISHPGFSDSMTSATLPDDTMVESTSTTPDMDDTTDGMGGSGMDTTGTGDTTSMAPMSDVGTNGAIVARVSALVGFLLGLSPRVMKCTSWLLFAFSCSSCKPCGAACQRLYVPDTEQRSAIARLSNELNV